LKVSSPIHQPLVSVIITCYNHGKYLSNAINSIYKQDDYSNIEIVLVDDGSVDNTKEECSKFPDVVYVYQDNSGLSAARNTGIRNSRGEYLVFLDADDWFLPGAIKTNADMLTANAGIAFVSGGHRFLYEKENITLDISNDIRNNYYCRLLEGNYIAMHATVMYRRFSFDTVLYDTSLKACEDYDVYLRVARKHQVLNHSQLIAVYRIHASNMSGNNYLMLQYVLKVLRLQEPFLKNDEERECYKRGIKNVSHYYTKELYDQLMKKIGQRPFPSKELAALWQYNRELFFKFSITRIKRSIKKLLPFV
jgi:glycosyltransferase involved in cell wall biosynthesis